IRGACARSNKNDRPFQYEEKDDERAIWSAGAGCDGRRVAAGARSRVQAHANGRPGGAHRRGRGQRRARASDRRHGGKGKAAAGAHAGGQQAGRARGGGRRLPRGEKRRPEHDRPVHRGVAANAPRQRGGENHAPRSDADRAPGAGARGHSGEGRCAVQDVRRFHRRRAQEPRAAQAVGRLQHQPRQRRAPAPAEIHRRALGLHLVPRRRRAHRGAPGRTRRYHGDRAGGGGRAYPRRQHARARADQRASPSRIPQRADLEGSRVRRAGRAAGPRRGCAAGNPEREYRVLGGLFPKADARAPKLVKHGAFRGSQLQVAYNKKLGKWILVTGASSPITSTTATAPNGKYDDPSLIEKTKQGPGLRGILIWDATDPANIVLLSEFSTDGGDPKRKIQTGSGTHRNYYDGGDYAYLDTAPDDSFTNMESPIRWHTNGIMVVDVSDPSSPKQVAMWWVPGQRTGEEAQYKAWREYGDKVSFTSLHGPMYVPKKVEDGGKLGFSAYGSFG